MAEERRLSFIIKMNKGEKWMIKEKEGENRG
jgi:hypothetical protein